MSNKKITPLVQETLPNNSHKAKELAAAEESPIEKDVKSVVSTPAVRKKKNWFLRAKDTIFTEEDKVDVKDILLFDIVIPTIRDTISEIGHTIVDGLTGGAINTRRYTRRNNTNNTPQSRINYGGFSPQHSTVNIPRRSAQSFKHGTGYSLDEVGFASKMDASNALSEMHLYIDMYGECSVADFFKLAGITPDWVDSNWGWRALPPVRDRRTLGGEYILLLPSPEPLR